MSKTAPTAIVGLGYVGLPWHRQQSERVFPSLGSTSTKRRSQASL